MIQFTLNGGQNIFESFQRKQKRWSLIFQRQIS
jgi:hypothetical protein